jgi:hypothetical protein
LTVPWRRFRAIRIPSWKGDATASGIGVAPFGFFAADDALHRHFVVMTSNSTQRRRAKWRYFAPLASREA